MCARTARRIIVGILTVLVAGTGFTLPAHAATKPPAGRLTGVRQNMFTHALRVTGWAADPSRPRAQLRVRVLVDGRFVRSVLADEPSRQADQAFGLTGRHGYAVTVHWSARAHQVDIRSRGASGGRITTLATRPVVHYYPPPGQRIVTVAKRLVGDRYVEGGASPSGFDCSGYTQYVYDHAHVKRLPHNAEAQMQGMRRIRRAHARPGDLVFYLRGGYAYHVAIYAGHGWQYAAATVRDGVRHQRVWSRNVRYGTDWH